MKACFFFWFQGCRDEGLWFIRFHGGLGFRGLGFRVYEV